MTTTHQFLNNEYFFPNWEVDTLFLGTFNPICGEQLDYYYRRNSNGFWKIIKNFDTQNEFNFTNFHELKQFMIFKRFGCVDIIRSITFPDNHIHKICGSGYSDDNLFKVKDYTREYNFQQIKDFIIDNSVSNIFTTWGSRDKPNEFKNLVNDFNIFCNENHISLIKLNSPSGRLYRGNGIVNINTNWFLHLNRLFL